jgi:hypothetical protein
MKHRIEAIKLAAISEQLGTGKTSDRFAFSKEGISIYSTIKSWEAQICLTGSKASFQITVNEPHSLLGCRQKSARGSIQTNEPTPGKILICNYS